MLQPEMLTTFRGRDYQNVLYLFSCVILRDQLLFLRRLKVNDIVFITDQSGVHTHRLDNDDLNFLTSLLIDHMCQRYAG